MSFGLNQYWTPTPKKIKKIADAILGAVTFAGTMLALNGKPEIATSIFIIGIITKFISNLFGDDSSQPNS